MLFRSRPIRIIQGPHTELDAPEHLDVDPVHNEIFVPTRHGTILVFPREGQGDVAPIRVLGGSNTMLGIDEPLAVDPVHNLLIMGGRTGRGETRRTLLLIFNRTEFSTAPILGMSNPRQ